MKPYERFIQRHPGLGWLIVGLIIGGGITLVATLVAIGVYKGFDKHEPVVKGNVACWFDADGRTLTVVKGEQKFSFPLGR